jgi:hypothetical protein
MDSLHSTGTSAYYPSQKPYTMAVASTAHLLETATTARYTSLYSGTRNDLDLLPVRRETYIFHPPSDVPTSEIAAAGFYFTGNRDISRCFRCRLEINRLKTGDNPMELHRTRSPNCPFVKAQQAASVSMTQRQDDSDDDDDEDCLDGFGFNDSDDSSSSDSDVEIDGPGVDNSDDIVLGKLEFISKNARYVETCAAATGCDAAASYVPATARHRKPKVAKPVGK